MRNVQEVAGDRVRAWGRGYCTGGRPRRQRPHVQRHGDKTADAGVSAARASAAAARVASTSASAARAARASVVQLPHPAPSRAHSRPDRYQLATKRSQGEDAVDLDDCGKVHVRQGRGNGRYRECLAHVADTSGVPGLEGVVRALRAEAGNADVACQTLKLAGLKPAAYSTFMRHDREGFRSRHVDGDAVVPPPRDPLASAMSQKKTLTNAPLFNGFVLSKHTVNGSHKENTTEALLKAKGDEATDPTQKTYWKQQLRHFNDQILRDRVVMQAWHEGALTDPTTATLAQDATDKGSHTTPNSGHRRCNTAWTGKCNGKSYSLQVMMQTFHSTQAKALQLVVLPPHVKSDTNAALSCRALLMDRLVELNIDIPPIMQWLTDSGPCESGKPQTERVQFHLWISLACLHVPPPHGAYVQAGERNRFGRHSNVVERLVVGPDEVSKLNSAYNARLVTDGLVSRLRHGRGQVAHNHNFLDQIGGILKADAKGTRSRLGDPAYSVAEVMRNLEANAKRHYPGYKVYTQLLNAAWDFSPLLDGLRPFTGNSEHRLMEIYKAPNPPSGTVSARCTMALNIGSMLPRYITTDDGGLAHDLELYVRPRPAPAPPRVRMRVRACAQRPAPSARCSPCAHACACAHAH